MSKFMIVVVALAAATFCGCRSVSVENFGQDYVRTDKGGAVLVDGKPVVFSKGWEVEHFQHWMVTKADTINATIKPKEIAFTLNGLSTNPDSEGLASVVKASLSGAAELAAKVAAAFASSGVTAGADAIYNYVKQFISQGGDASKATVTISDGKVVCTDGSCTVTGACSE